ncbi:MAG: ABC transporter permease [bacterium]|nr:ABC transporter permease [bacterium]MDE0290537.1 ABC transporter permease [bacterium]MDE0436934.1 ABC transporter permease [bacterium]
MVSNTRVGTHRLAIFIGRMASNRLAGPTVVLVGLCVFFQLRSGKFFTATQIEGMTSVAASISIISAGITMLMFSGEFDLSVASVYAIGPILFALLLTKADIWVFPAFLIALILCSAVGLFNGLITTRFGIPSLITTLGSSFAIIGTAIFISEGDNLLYFDESRLFTILGGDVGNAPVPAQFLWALLIVGVLWYVTDLTEYGNWSRSAGGRRGVAREMGVPVNRVKTTNFVVSSTLAGFAGIATFTSFRTVSAGYGSNFELLAIVATVVGGTSIFGVTGSVLGAFIGTLILASLRTGLILVGAPGAWYTAIIGILLIAAVISNIRIGRAGDRLLEVSQRWLKS